MQADRWGNPWEPGPSCPHAEPSACPSRGHPAYCKHARCDLPSGSLLTPGEVYWRGVVAAAEPCRIVAPERRSDPEPRPIGGLPTIPQWAFLTAEDLARDSVQLARKLSTKVNLIIGVARSGLVPASIVAALLHRPLATFNKARGLRFPGAGFRMDGYVREPIRSIVIVDDTAAYGREMDRATFAVRGRWPDAEIIRAVVYASPHASQSVDVAIANYPGSHYLEWNWNNAGHGAECLYDFDGILCEECQPADNDDGDRYRRFLEDARPLFLPRRAIVPAIVTGRHERYREPTVRWLERHGVMYHELIMRDFEERRGMDWQDAMARFKGDFYRRHPAVLFAESEPRQAMLIHRYSDKPVLCPAAKQVFGFGNTGLPRIEPEPGAAVAATVLPYDETDQKVIARLHLEAIDCEHAEPINGSTCKQYCTRLNRAVSIGGECIPCRGGVDIPA